MMLSSVIAISQPLYEPVSLSMAKEWLRVTNAHSDNVIRLLISAMRADAENRTGRVFVPRTMRYSGVTWPTSLPYPPIVAINSVTYLDVEGVRQTLDPSMYTFDSVTGAFMPTYGSTWPAPRYCTGSVEVIYNAGYAPGSPADEAGYQAAMPPELQLWIQTKIATLFENREQIIVGTIVAALPHSYVDSFLDPLIVGERLF